MSSIHALQSSTTREKLLKSVEALRPSLYESLRSCGFDPYMHFNAHDHDLQQPHYVNSCNPGSEEHGMIAQGHAREHDQVHMVYELQDAACNVGNLHYHAQHAHIFDKRHESGGRQLHPQYDPIGFGHNVIVHAEEINGDLSGYVQCHDDFDNIHDLALHQCSTGYERECKSSNSSVNVPELSANIDPGILCSLESSMDPHGMHSFTSPGFISQDDCIFPNIEEPLQPSTDLHPHSVYTYNPHLHSQQEFRDYPQCPDIIDGPAASMYTTAIDHLPLATTPTFLSAEAQVINYTTTSAKSASLFPSHLPKKQRPKPLPDANAKQNSSVDVATDSLQDINGDNCCDPNAARTAGFSSNIVCERRRRKKINDALYALRSVVPHVSKMDKASIMSDALTYAKQLQKRVDDLQNDIRKLHADSTSMDELKVKEESSGSTNNPNKGMDFEEYFHSLPKHKILELSVFNMENDTYHLHICCEKGPGDLLQLTRVIEALNFDILNNSVASIGEQSTINTIIQVDMDDALKPQELKARMLDIVNKCGLYL